MRRKEDHGSIGAMGIETSRTGWIIVLAVYVYTAADFGGSLGWCDNFFLQFLILNFETLIADFCIVHPEDLHRVGGLMRKGTESFQALRTNVCICADLCENMVGTVFIFGGYLNFFYSTVQPRILVVRD